MIVVKLTFLGIILLSISLIVGRILVMASSTKTKLKIALHNPPTWALVMSFIWIVLGIFDIVGIVYSTVWFLFIR